MGAGRGSCCKRIVALILGLGIVATIAACCAIYIPRRLHSKEIDDGLPKVSNKDAYKNGGATKHPTKTDVGKAEGQDHYQLYQGDWTQFPDKDEWVTFDHLWDSNLQLIKTACTDHQWGEDNSDNENDMIKSSIEWVSRASHVDNRLILAIIVQESKGCLRVTSTDSVHGVHNPGLMQSHDGSSYNPDDKKNSIRQMIKDGTQGTAAGDGLVQTLDKFGNAYSAARGYNSGDVGPSGDLGDAIGATPCYASDVANRLMGWVAGDSPCDPSQLGVEQSTGTSGQTQSDTGGQTQSNGQDQSGGQAQSNGQSATDWSNGQSGQQGSESTSSTSGANADGTYSGGHWDINGNYVKGGSGGSSRKRRVMFKA